MVIFYFIFRPWRTSVFYGCLRIMIGAVVIRNEMHTYLMKHIFIKLLIISRILILRTQKKTSACIARGVVHTLEYTRSISDSKET